MTLVSMLAVSITVSILSNIIYYIVRYRNDFYRKCGVCERRVHVNNYRVVTYDEVTSVGFCDACLKYWYDPMRDDDKVLEDVIPVYEWSKVQRSGEILDDDYYEDDSWE